VLGTACLGTTVLPAEVLLAGTARVPGESRVEAVPVMGPAEEAAGCAGASAGRSEPWVAVGVPRPAMCFGEHKWHSAPAGECKTRPGELKGFDPMQERTC
jgi:hypothetical protein